MGPLDGIKVLDLTRAMAGPYCALLLGDYGADVIKIEQPGIGDDTRRWVPPEIDGISTYFLSINRNRRSLTLNLKHDQGRRIFLDLAKNADVVLENFTPGTMNRFGLDYETVAATNSRMVFCSISGFGQTGPYKFKPGYDQIIQGMGGLMSLTGEAGRPPVKVGISINDICAGMFASYAIAMALISRATTNVGQYIDISMLDCQVAWLTYQAGRYLYTGDIPEKTGSGHPSIVPYQAFRCRDGKYLNVAVATEQFWKQFCSVINRKDLRDHPDFNINSNRVANRDELIPILEKRISEKSMQTWMRLLEDAGVPCGPIYDLKELFNDPQVQARQMVTEISHPSLGRIAQTGLPIKLSSTPGSIRSHPPLLGEHTRSILMEEGYSDDTITQLSEDGVI